MGILNYWQNSSDKFKTFAAGGAVLTTIFAIIGGVAPAIEAWDNLGMPTAAMRGWTRSYVVDKEKPISQTLAEVKQILAIQNSQAIQLAVDLANSKIDDNYDKIQAWKLELNKTADPASKNIIEGRISELTRTVAQLQSQLETLKAVKRSQ
jgi:hypothetical protein